MALFPATPVFRTRGDQVLSSIDLSPWIGSNGVNGATNLTTPGIGLAIMHNGSLVYNHGWGTYADATQVVTIIESASKLPAMVCLLAMLEAGLLNAGGLTGLAAIDTTILQQRPDWATYSTSMGLNNGAANGATFLSGTARGNTTLRSLMNHIGGYEFAINAAMSDQSITLEQCAIYCAAVDPGTLGYSGGAGSVKFGNKATFAYNGNDYQVLGAIMANKAGTDWPTAFNARVVAPLGISSSRMFYPAIGAGANNPIIPRYLNTDAVSYCTLMQMILNGGVAPNGTRVLSQNAVNLLKLNGNYNGLHTTYNPWESLGFGAYIYAGGMWINPTPPYPRIWSDEGFSGFSPWFDTLYNYCACISLSQPTTDASGGSNGWAIGRAIKNYLRPLLETHLGM